MEKKQGKLKGWYERNKSKIVPEVGKLLWYCVGFGVGAFAAGKIAEIRIGNGIERFTNDGIIKYFDPSTGHEVNINEAVNVVKRMYGKK